MIKTMTVSEKNEVNETVGDSSIHIDKSINAST